MQVHNQTQKLQNAVRNNNRVEILPTSDKKDNRNRAMDHHQTTIPVTKMETTDLQAAMRNPHLDLENEKTECFNKDYGYEREKLCNTQKMMM